MEDNFGTLLRMLSKHSQEEFAPLVQAVQQSFLEIENSRRDTGGQLMGMEEQMQGQNAKTEWLYRALEQSQGLLQQICHELTRTRQHVDAKVEGLMGVVAGLGGTVTQVQRDLNALGQR